MKKEFYFPSKDGMTQIHAMEWIPEGEVQAVLQIVHGRNTLCVMMTLLHIYQPMESM